MELFSSSLFKFVSLIILLAITRSNSAPNKKRTKTNKKDVNIDVKEKFSTLLTTIADMNEKRFKALKEYSELDSYKAGDGILRDLKHNKMTVLSKTLTKDIIYLSLLDGICKGGISPELARYKEIINRVNKVNLKLTEVTLNEEYLKHVVNKVLREMICENPHITANGLELEHNNDDFETESFDDDGNRARSIKSYLNEIKKLETVQKYVKSRHYKAGSAILDEGSDDNNGHIDEIILINDRSTKAVIADVVSEMICKDGIYPELRGYNNLIKADESENSFDVLMLNDDITKKIVKVVLKEMICKRTKIPKNETSKKLRLLADYYDDSVGLNDVDRIQSPIPIDSSQISSDTNVIIENDSEDLDEDDYDTYENDRFDTNYDEERNNPLAEEIHEIEGSLRSSCWKKARKNCKKACKRALKDVCDVHTCSKRMKKDFKKKCKRNCKDDYY